MAVTAAALTSIIFLILIMASIMVVIWSFMASMSLARDFCKETTHGAFWFAYIFYFLRHAFSFERARIIAPHISQA